MSSSIYQMWLLRDQGASRIPFPVLPEKYMVTFGNNTTPIEIIGLGELALYNDPNAMRVSFSSMFPPANDPALEAYVPDNLRAMGAGMWKFLFDSFLNREDILQLNIVGTPINFHCLCERYQMTEEGGDVGAYYYDMSFVEYRKSGLELVTIDPVTNQAELPPQEPKRLDTRVAPSNYTVQPGDTLASIAKQVYGDDNMYNSLYEKNKDRMSNPQLLEPGTVLQMPL